MKGVTVGRVVGKGVSVGLLAFPPQSMDERTMETININSTMLFFIETSSTSRPGCPCALRYPRNVFLTTDPEKEPHLNLYLE
jgi:hypothetical protein